MTPDTKHGASFGAASTTAELADALRHIDRAITSPRENATLHAAADRLVELQRCLSDASSVPEGCTPEDARILREANHRLAVELEADRRLLKDALRIGEQSRKDAAEAIRCHERVEAYAERLRRTLEVVRTRVQNDMGALITCDVIDAALAKNPNPSGEPATGAKADAAGPEGAGPAHVCGLAGYDGMRDGPCPGCSCVEQKRREGIEQVNAEARAFFDRHALGSMLAPSCIVCGHLTPLVFGVRHMELPNVVVCKFCKDASERAYREANGLEDAPKMERR